MKEIILLKDGEIALKGLNRSSFEDLLIKNVKRKLAPLGRWTYWKAQSTIYCTPEDPADMEEALERVGKVFGVAAYCRALVTEKSYEALAAAAPDYLRAALLPARTFKVVAKRSDKSFPMQSPEICRELGGLLLSHFPHLRVDVENPEVTVMAEIRERGAYLHAGQTAGAGGIPVGSSGRAALLISGGIDSPVAGWMMAKRGIELSAIHFESPPYTSERARQKVFALLEKLVPWCGRIRCYVVPFTRIQEQIRQDCPEEYFTIIMRRFMMRIADTIARRARMGALVTGESVGQVASQTMLALGCTDIVTRLPVFRPVIGMDKLEIVSIARKIDTYETSILPYEDCCTVFTPRHPRTRPVLETVEEIEGRLDVAALCEEAVSATATQWFNP
ncbi:MAG: tRNA 4-thiouridine(8) synthase ThiI [Provencibacterium sp.]|nr:tRNA 4-thiouridine(8) synthase ThiI [Provencibacterium sp.]